MHVLFVLAEAHWGICTEVQFHLLKDSGDLEELKSHGIVQIVDV